jgi:hypothetical protein
VLFGNRLIRLLVYMAIGTLWLAGCGQAPTPTAEVAMAIIVEGTQAPPPTSEPTTAVPTATVTEMPSPSPPASTTTPQPPQPTASPALPTGEPYYEDRSGPTRLLASYYNAINRQEYARAWAYWENPPDPSFENFVRGFSDTASVLLAVRPPTWFEGAAGSTYTSIPALMTAKHTDGSRHNFVGCFVARRSNVGAAGAEQEWLLYEATVHLTPGNSTDAMLMARVCDPVPESAYSDRSGAVPLLASYYNAINLGEYSRAWGYWETPPDPSFEEFAEGFADTESVMLVVQPPIRFEGAAGSTYVGIPTLLSASHTDGSQHNFVGCFFARRPNVGGSSIEQEWLLFDAAVRASPGNTNDVPVLDLDCTTR